jgi:hypothetical protein
MMENPWKMMEDDGRLWKKKEKPWNMMEYDGR